MSKNQRNKCSSNEHEEIEAITYCEQCKIYMCKKCENFHSKLFKNHCIFNLSKEENNNLFIELCLEANHSIKLDYYCKTHNKLCCAACIAKIKTKENGQHRDCDIYSLDEIKEEKRKILNINIKYLEKLSNNIEETINEIKKLFEKINENKEQLKSKIQKIFTEIKNNINEREEELLLEVDKQNDILFINENIIKDSEKLPTKINNFLKYCKMINNEWNKNKLSKSINDCIEMEKKIKDIDMINEKIKNCKLNIYSEIKFSPEEPEIKKFIETIKKFGLIKKSRKNNRIIQNKDNNNTYVNNIKFIEKKKSDENNNFNKIEINNNLNPTYNNNYINTYNINYNNIYNNHNFFNPNNYNKNNYNNNNKNNYNINNKKNYNSVNRLKKEINFGINNSNTPNKKNNNNIMNNISSYSANKRNKNLNLFHPSPIRTRSFPKKNLLTNSEKDYKKELDQLRNMGFTNENNNINALKESEGKLEVAIEILLNSKN